MLMLHVDSKRQRRRSVQQRPKRLRNEKQLKRQSRQRNFARSRSEMLLETSDGKLASMTKLRLQASILPMTKTRTWKTTRLLMKTRTWTRTWTKKRALTIRKSSRTKAPWMPRRSVCAHACRPPWKRLKAERPQEHHGRRPPRARSEQRPRTRRTGRRMTWRPCHCLHRCCLLLPNLMRQEKRRRRSARSRRQTSRPSRSGQRRRKSRMPATCGRSGSSESSQIAFVGIELTFSAALERHYKCLAQSPSTACHQSCNHFDLCRPDRQQKNS